jgi:hypothetical protein
MRRRKETMKRIVAILLLMTIFISSASAESIDVSVMSIAELLALREVIDKELEIRIDTNDPSLIGSGQYEVGSMIKPGNYRFVATSSGNNYNTVLVTILTDEGRTKLDPWYQDYVTVGETAVLCLEEGATLIIQNGSGRMTAFEPTWAQ